ncbi:dentin sialophosphoprotein [Exaiptasia diaphana]|uniref:Uncharacterized protein n=1 Tax=Exaiptasia diaphana TaxID=2652724 RepID=A0A913XKS6_EXADI|nr:dentin sialophosphoprotein [Exaiptasia diaphana]
MIQVLRAIYFRLKCRDANDLVTSTPQKRTLFSSAEDVVPFSPISVQQNDSVVDVTGSSTNQQECTAVMVDTESVVDVTGTSSVGRNDCTIVNGSVVIPPDTTFQSDDSDSEDIPLHEDTHSIGDYLSLLGNESDSEGSTSSDSSDSEEDENEDETDNSSVASDDDISR